MSGVARIAAFAAVLAVVFAGAAVAGDAIDPERGEREATNGHAETAASAHGERGEAHGGSESHQQPVRGLAVAENGLRIVVHDPDLRRGRTERLSFSIVDERGETVRDFDVEHEKRMHVILARRDLTGFQHLHPTQAEDGRWTTDARVEEAGSYRLFADFAREGESFTLASDLRVDGPANLEALPAPSRTAVSDGGYDVRLEAARARPGREAELRFTIAKDGHVVHPEPYLGAGGHLVALREGDLAFLHVHPTEHPRDAAEIGHDDAVGFAATFPTEGRYRLFLQFRHEGRVHTVAFTQEVR